MKPSTLYTVVGIFVLLGLLAAGYLTLNLGNTALFARGMYTISAHFGSVSGLRVGSTVEISGVPVGKVADIQLDQEQFYQARVVMQIHNAIRIPTDSSAAIKTSGLIGDKYVQIIPGADDKNLSDGGSILDTKSALDIEEMVSKYVFGSVKQ
ncbi:MAG: outer membrane lipid asymmetry maintenance protein MlaD [Desulfomicrobiaceae bacterium]